MLSHDREQQKNPVTHLAGRYMMHTSQDETTMEIVFLRKALQHNLSTAGSDYAAPKANLQGTGQQSVVWQADRDHY